MENTENEFRNSQLIGRDGKPLYQKTERIIKINKAQSEKKNLINKPLSDKDIIETDRVKEVFLTKSVKAISERDSKEDKLVYPNNPFYNLSEEGLTVLFDTTSEFRFGHSYFREAELTITSYNLLMYIMEQLEDYYYLDGVATDYISLNQEKTMKLLRVTSWATIGASLKQLCFKGILARKSNSEYWINPYYLFFGTKDFFFNKLKGYMRQYIPSLYLKYKHLES